jgi:hypothetical protein
MFLQAILFVIIAVSNSFADISSTRLSINQHSMTVNGHLKLPIELDKIGNLKIDLDFAPSFGYFVYDGLLINLGLKIAKTLYDNQPQPVPLGPTNWGPKLSLAYYFDTNTIIYPYLGIGTSMLWDDAKFCEYIITLDIPVGILIALKKYLALDIGIPISFESTNQNFLYNIKIPIGYLGLMGFF